MITMRHPAILIALVLFAPAASPSFSLDDPPQALVHEVAGGKIAWGTAVYYATGDALMPSESEESNRTKAYQKAKSHARTKAIANLLLTVDATEVNYAIAGRDLAALDDTLRRTIENLALSAEMISDRRKQEAGETVVEVTVQIPMFGPMGPGTALLRSLVQQERLGHGTAQIRIETPKPKVKAEAPANQKGPFTSIIVDARGFDLHRAINPKIRRPDSTEVWGVFKLESALPLDRGPVSYAASIEDAKRSVQAGRNPLIVRAVGRAGGPTKCDAVVTIESAETILSQEKAGHYLRDYRVIFLVDSANF